MNLNQPLAPGRYYHIYNRGINSENLFREVRNYNYFLRKYVQFLIPVVDTFAYCLLKNHFHLLIHVKDEITLYRFYNKKKKSNRHKNGGLHSAEFIVSKQFARLFSSYTQTINRAYRRTGSLVETPFNRIEVPDEVYLTELIRYIHLNPKKHGFVDDFRNYGYSSYSHHLNDPGGFLNSDAVINWFGGIVQYEEFHQKSGDPEMLKNWLPEYYLP
jgi:REP element-mobilizing transposase RayT